jgi:hypothetical protein
MILKLRTYDEQIETYTDTKKVERTNRIVTFLDASSEGKKLKQVIDLQLPGDHPAVGLDRVVEVEVTEFQEFSGRPRIRGTILTPAPGGKQSAAPTKP